MQLHTANQTPQQKVAAFFASYPIKEFSAGELLVRAESDPPGIFYLIDGRVIQYDIAQNGNTIVVNTFKPFAFFPMSWAINHTANAYFFEATGKVTAHLAPADNAVQFLQTNPDVLFDLLSRVYRGTDGVLRRMAHLMGGNVKSRLVFELINASLRFGKPATIAVLLPLSEKDLAHHSGLARESVSRALQSLKAEGLVEVTKDGLVVKSVERLQAALGNDL